MVNLCYYVSDYGYGHASRSIAVIRAYLKSLTSTTIYVRTEYPFKFMKKSLPQKNVIVSKAKNDVGVIFSNDLFEVDKTQTKNLFEGWVSTWNRFIQEEKTFCKLNKIDAILSDVPPQPLIVANELEIPSIIISNFTWFYIYNHLFGETDVVQKLKKTYSLANIALVLPFNEKITYIKKRKTVGLVSREISMDRSFIRKKLGVSSDDTLVFLSVGKSFNSTAFRDASS